MKPVNFKVGEDEYQLIPHTGFEAINLDRKVLGLMGRFSSSSNFDSKNAFALLAGALESYTDSEFRWLVDTTLSRVTVITSGKKSVSLSDMNAVSDHFGSHMQDMYTVLFEVWRLEKLSPFAEAPNQEKAGA